MVLKTDPEDENTGMAVLQEPSLEEQMGAARRNANLDTIIGVQRRFTGVDHSTVPNSVQLR